MNKTRRYLVLALVTVLSASSAFAAEFSLVGDATFSNTAFSDLPSGTTKSTTASAGYGGGALLNFRLMHMSTLEIGGLYTKKKFDTTVNSGAATTSSGYYLQVPALFRYWLSPFFSVGAGGFWERGMSGSFSSGTRNDDGFLGSVGLRFPLGSWGTKLLLDGRYYWGLTNLATTSGQTEHYRDVQALVGISFALSGGHRY